MVDPTQNYGILTSIPSIVIPPSEFAGSGTHAYKVGDDSGNISVTATSFTDIQAGMDVTIQVLVGQIAVAWLVLNGVSAAGNNLTVGIAVDGTVGPGQSILNGNLNQVLPMYALALLVGDGNNHTFKPQVKTAGGTATIANSGGQDPTFVVLVVPAT